MCIVREIPNLWRRILNSYADPLAKAEKLYRSCHIARYCQSRFCLSMEQCAGCCCAIVYIEVFPNIDFIFS